MELVAPDIGAEEGAASGLLFEERMPVPVRENVRCRPSIGLEPIIIFGSPLIGLLISFTTRCGSARPAASIR